MAKGIGCAYYADVVVGVGHIWVIGAEWGRQACRYKVGARTGVVAPLPPVIRRGEVGVRRLGWSLSWSLSRQGDSRVERGLHVFSRSF